MHYAIYHNTHPEFVDKREQLLWDKQGPAYNYAALIIEMITDTNTTAGALAAGRITTRTRLIDTDILGIWSDVPGALSNLLTTFETYIRRHIISYDINSSCFIKPPDCGQCHAAALAMYANCGFVIGDDNHRVIDSELALKRICSGHRDGHVRGMRVIGKEIKHQPPTTPPQDVMEAVLLRRRFHDDMVEMGW